MQIPEPDGLLPGAPGSVATSLASGMEGAEARRRVHPGLSVARVEMRDASRTFESIAGARAGTGPPVPLKADVLMVNGDDHCPPCTQYRVLAPAEALRAAGHSVIVINASDVHRLAGCDLQVRVAVIFRALGDENLSALLDHLRRSQTPLAWDVDDLLFDGARPLGSLQAATSPSERLDGPDSAGTRAAAAEVGRRCDWYLAPTPDLLAAAVAEGIVRGGAITPSFLTARQLAIGEDALARAAGRRARDGVVIGYSSGTPTHGADFAIVAPALSAVMRRRPEVRLRVFGPLDVAGFGLPAGRVEHVPDVVHDWGALMERMASVSVSIVPLELDNGYCRAKSEVKYLEASCAGTPTIASATPAYARAIDAPATGRLVGNPHDWEAVLLDVVDDSAWRQLAGMSARARAAAVYGPGGPMAREYVRSVEAVMAGAPPPEPEAWPDVLGAGGEPFRLTGALCVIGANADPAICGKALCRLRVEYPTEVTVADFREYTAGPESASWRPGCSWVDLASALRRAGVVEVIGELPSPVQQLIRGSRAGASA